MKITGKSKFLLCFLFLIVGITSFAWHMQPKYYLSIGTIFRNEARFLSEWIEYHRLRGVQHFYLFNHLSEDEYQVALKPYLQQGIVELYEWPYPAKDQKEWNKIQCRAYMKLIKEKKFETFWLALLDTDEFLVPMQTSNLQTFLNPYESYGGIVINWQLFGTSHIKCISPGKTVIGSLKRRAPTNHPTNHFVKSIIQPRKVKKISEPHYCHYHHPFYHVTENFVPLPSKSLSPTVSINKIRIHHYTYRDELFFQTEKLKRYKEWHPHDPPLHSHPSYDEVEDLTLQPYAIEVERVIR